MVTFLVYLHGYLDKIGLDHKILPGFVFSEQELQLFPSHTLPEILNDILKKALAL